MTPQLHFPNKETMISFLTDQGFLNDKYYKELGITKAIAELSAKRFADSDKGPDHIKMGAFLIINDLIKGKDGFTHEDLPNLGKLDLPLGLWQLMSKQLEEALTNCTNNKSKE